MQDVFFGASFAYLQAAPITDPAYWERWAGVPLVAYLFITLVVVLVGATREWWHTRPYVRQMREHHAKQVSDYEKQIEAMEARLRAKDREIEELRVENAQITTDFVRLTDRFDTAFTRVMTALIERGKS